MSQLTTAVRIGYVLGVLCFFKLKSVPDPAGEAFSAPPDSLP